jgi:hypothetical protein
LGKYPHHLCISEYTIPARHAAINGTKNTTADGMPRNSPCEVERMNPAVSRTIKNPSLTVLVRNQNPTNTQRYMIPQMRMMGAPVMVYAPGISADIFGIPKCEVITRRSGSP